MMMPRKSVAEGEVDGRRPHLQETDALPVLENSERDDEFQPARYRDVNDKVSTSPRQSMSMAMNSPVEVELKAWICCARILEGGT